MNKITLIGNSCKDAELQTKGETQYTQVNLAVSRKFDREKTDFFNCVAFGKLATDVVSKYVKRGSKIAIVGRLEFNEDQEGKRHHSVVIEDIDLLTPKSEQVTSKLPASDIPGLTPVDDDEQLPF